MPNSFGRSILGFIMFVSGLYLLLSSIHVNVSHMFHGRHSLFQVGGYGVTSGAILIVFMLGVGMLFFNGKNPLGWLVTAGSLVALIVGIIFNTELTLAYLNGFELVLILVLLCGGLGLLLSAGRGKT